MSTCATCGNDFNPISVRQVCCSRPCKDKRYAKLKFKRIHHKPTKPPAESFAAILAKLEAYNEGHPHSPLSYGRYVQAIQNGQIQEANNAL